jgi:hypothetical protein
MRGHSRSKNGVASLAYAAIRANDRSLQSAAARQQNAAWIAGSSPEMTL